MCIILIHKMNYSDHFFLSLCYVDNFSELQLFYGKNNVNFKNLYTVMYTNFIYYYSHYYYYTTAQQLAYIQWLLRIVMEFQNPPHAYQGKPYMLFLLTCIPIVVKLFSTIPCQSVSIPFHSIPDTLSSFFL